MSEKLKRPKIAFKDEIIAEILTFGSGIASVLPVRANFIGRSAVLSYTPLRWRHLRTPFDIDKGAWVHYEGISSSGNTPKNYGDAVIVLVDRVEMDALRARNPERDSQDAISYRLGSTVMFGTSSKYEILGLENETDEDYKVAMRRGKGPLDAQIAIKARARFGIDYYYPLERGVRPGPVLLMPEVPAVIPLV